MAHRMMSLQFLSLLPRTPDYSHVYNWLQSSEAFVPFINPSNIVKRDSFSQKAPPFLSSRQQLYISSCGN